MSTTPASLLRPHHLRLSVIALLSWAGAWGQDIQVSPDGPFTTITAALNAANPGDNVKVAGGVYRESIKPTKGGRPGASITVMPLSEKDKVVVSALDQVDTTPVKDPSGVLSYDLRDILRDSPWDPTYGYDAAQVFAGSDADPDTLRMLPEARLPHCPDPRWPERYRLVPTGAVACHGDGTWTFTVAPDVAIPDGERADWGQALVTLLVAGRVGQTFELLSSRGNVLTVRGQGKVPTDLVNVTALTNLDGNLVQIHRTRKALAEPGEWLVERDAAGRDRLIVRPVTESLLIKARPWTVDVGDTGYITLKNLDLVGGGVRSGPQSCGLELKDCHLSYVGHYSVTSSKIGGYSVEIGAAHPAGDGAIGCLLAGSGHVITGCTIAYSAGHGVLLQGSGHLLANNIIHDVGYGLNDGAGIGCIPDADGRPARELLLKGNLVYRGARSLIRLSSSAASLIDHNELWHGSMAGRDTGAIYTWGTNDLLAGRDAAWNAGHPRQTFWNTISNNLIHDPTRVDAQNVGYFHTQGIYLDVASEHQQIVGNVIIFANADVRRGSSPTGDFPTISSQLSYGIEALGGAHDHLIADNRILTTASGAINITAGSRWNEIRNNLLTQPVDADQRWDVGVFTGNTYGGFADKFKVEAPLVESKPAPIALATPAGNVQRSDWAALLGNFPDDDFTLRSGSGDQSVGNSALKTTADGLPVIHEVKVVVDRNRVFLYAAATANPGRKLLHYTWECLSRSDLGAKVAWDPINGSVLASRLPVNVDKVGTYTFRLVVSNPSGSTVWGKPITAVVKSLPGTPAPAIGIQVVSGTCFAQTAPVERTGDGRYLIQVDRLPATDGGPAGDQKLLAVEALGFQPATVPAANRAYAWTVSNATRLVSGTTSSRVDLDHLVIGDTLLTLTCTDTRNGSFSTTQVVIRTLDWTAQFSVGPLRAIGRLNGLPVGNEVGFDQAAPSSMNLDQPEVDLSETTRLPSAFAGVLTHSWSHVSGPVVTFSATTGPNTRATISAFSPDWNAKSVVRVRTTWTRSDGLSTFLERDIALMYLNRKARVSLAVGAEGTFEDSRCTAVAGALQVTSPSVTITANGTFLAPIAGNLVYEVAEGESILARGEASSWPLTLTPGIHTLSVNLYDPLVSLGVPVRRSALKVTILDPSHQFSVTGLALTPKDLAVQTTGIGGMVKTPVPDIILAARTRDAYTSSAVRTYAWRVSGPARPGGIVPFVATASGPAPILKLTDPGAYTVDLAITAGLTTGNASFTVMFLDQLVLAVPTPALTVGNPSWDGTGQVAIALGVPPTGFTVNGNPGLVGADWWVGSSLDPARHGLTFPAVLSRCGSTVRFAPTLVGVAGGRVAYPPVNLRGDFSQVTIGLAGKIDALQGTSVVSTTVTDQAVYPQFRIAKARTGVIALSVPTLSAQVAVTANGAPLGTLVVPAGDFSCSWTWNAVDAVTGAPATPPGSFSSTSSATPTFTCPTPGLIYYLKCTISSPLGVVGSKTLRLRVDAIAGTPG